MKEQAKHIIATDGLCPHTLCSSCVITKMIGSCKGCNPEVAVRAAKEFLEKKTV